MGMFSKRIQQFAAFGFGFLFVITLLGLAVAFPEPTAFQYTVFRVTLALAASGIAAMIPGFLEVQVPNAVRAGGALGVFVVVYFFNPAALLAPTSVHNTINRIERGVYVDRRVISYSISVSGPEALERLVEALAAREGIGHQSVQELATKAIPAPTKRQIAEVVQAQRQSSGRGIRTTPQTNYRLGMLATYSKHYEDALSYFREAVEGDPDYNDAYKAIAWLQQYRAMDDISVSGDYSAALDKLHEAREAATRTDPLDARALALRGYIYKTLAQVSEAVGDKAGRDANYDQAARLFEHVAKLRPDNASAHNGLGNVLQAQGQIDAAIAAYDRAIALAPTYTAAHHDLAIAYETKMDRDPDDAAHWCREALEEWRTTSELAPRDPSFSAGYLRVIAERVRWLEQRCGG